MAFAMYCTREDVKNALDVAATARSDAQIDREIQASTETISKTLRRVFYPTVATRSFDWLDHQYSLTWRLWLDSNELAAPPTQVLSAGVDITAGVLARNGRGDDQPPYTYLEVDLSTDATLMASSTYQRAITVLGPYGYNLDENPGGTLASAITSASQTTATVSNSALVGVGSILRFDNERMIVTDKNMVITGQTLQGALTAQNNDTLVPVIDGTQFATSEVILVDAEKMRVDEIAGNNLIVKRAWDGSTLAAHSTSTSIYAARQMTLARGQLGTTAATHSYGATINVHAVPGLIRTLAVGDTLVRLGLERSGYVQILTRGAAGLGAQRQTIGDGLNDLWQRAKDSYQRKIRVRTAARHL